jgi:hypothetical protein
MVDLSVSPYCAETNFFKDDPVHFKPDVGVRMLNTEVIAVAERAMRKNGEPAPLQIDTDRHR